MARLVARALRLGRSALIQVGAVCGYQGRYRTSFVASALMWHGPVIIVAQEAVQQLMLRVEIPRLQQWLPANKSIRTGDAWPDAQFQGLLLTSPEAWLRGQFAGDDRFPQGIPTIIDGVDDLEDWVRHQLTQDIQPHDWEQLMLACPNQAEAIREARIQLTHELFQHPANPYQCYLISQPEIEILSRLYLALDQANLPNNWKNFWLPSCYSSSFLGDYCSSTRFIFFALRPNGIRGNPLAFMAATTSSSNWQCYRTGN